MGVRRRLDHVGVISTLVVCLHPGRSLYFTEFRVEGGVVEAWFHHWGLPMRLCDAWVVQLFRVILGGSCGK